jgi:hypothetical protein
MLRDDIDDEETVKKYFAIENPLYRHHPIWKIEWTGGGDHIEEHRPRPEVEDVKIVKMKRMEMDESMVSTMELIKEW